MNLRFLIFSCGLLALLPGCVTQKTPTEESQLHDITSEQLKNDESKEMVKKEDPKLNSCSNGTKNSVDQFEVKSELTKNDIEMFVSWMTDKWDKMFEESEKKCPIPGIWQQESKDILQTTIDLMAAKRIWCHKWAKRNSPETMVQLNQFFASMQVEFDEISKKLKTFPNKYPEATFTKNPEEYEAVNNLVAIAEAWSKLCEVSLEFNFAVESELVTSAPPSIYKAKATADKTNEKFYSSVIKLFEKNFVGLTNDARIELSNQLFKLADQSIIRFFNEYKISASAAQSTLAMREYDRPIIAAYLLLNGLSKMMIATQTDTRIQAILKALNKVVTPAK